MYEIKHRYTGKVLFRLDTAMTAKETVEEATKARANLADANLTGTNLAGANLAGANLADANLTGTNLAGANLADADLAYANLAGTNLAGANLADADLAGANLAGANLAGANLADAKNAELAKARTEILPREGEVVGWKQCENGVLVKLRIPPEAKRSNATGRKCRAEFADVLEVVGADVGISKHDGKTEYRVGSRVTCHEWCNDRFVECAGGVHFYITREEAEDN